MKEILTMNDLIACEVGQPILRHGKKEVYAGMEFNRYGSFACGCANVQQVPVVIRLTSDGNIERIADPVFENSSYAIIHQVKEGDPKFQKYKGLLGMP